MSGTNIKLYKNDKLILDCTLCTNPEGRIGWWDAVEGKFHDQTENILKQAYKEPMGTQYIDTGVPITNADHIRSMTDEELVAFLAPAFSCYGCPARLFCEKDEVGTDCHELVSNWLKQPYKEDE